MSLPHVILTVLSHHDATGYDITKEFSSAIGYFWKASHQQVYRELNKLADQGAVSCLLNLKTESRIAKSIPSLKLASKAFMNGFYFPPNIPQTATKFQQSFSPAVFSMPHQ